MVPSSLCMLVHSPQDHALDQSSEVVGVENTNKKDAGRSAMRVITGTPRGSKNKMVSAEAFLCWPIHSFLCPCMMA